MKQHIQGAYKKYNANLDNTSTGDCVKRALSIAYGMPYDKVASELNAIKRDVGAPAFNYSTVYGRFMRRTGLIKSGGPKSFGIQDNITVTQFCELFPSGTWCIEVGKPGKIQSTHILCVMDGDFWDSWDSSTWIVHFIYQISDEGRQVYELSVDAVQPELSQHVRSCIAKSQKKMPWATFEFERAAKIDNTTYRETILCHISLEQTGLSYAKHYVPEYRYTIKLNPTMSLEENLSKLKERLWYKVREWAYAIRHEVETDMAVKTMSTHPSFHGDKELLLKLPEWCRLLITYARDAGDSAWSDRYTVDMDALPDDPRAADAPGVTFYGDTLKELKTNIEDYRQHFNRFGYDY